LSRSFTSNTFLCISRWQTCIFLIWPSIIVHVWLPYSRTGITQYSNVSNLIFRLFVCSVVYILGSRMLPRLVLFFCGSLFLLLLRY
jgi:hypothetical protein